MNDPTVEIVTFVRKMMAKEARLINRLFRGKLKPGHITLLSFLGHIPAAWALYTCRPILAAVLIAVFGILDAFDGALAREQKSASKIGMLLDSVSDRLKEILVYSALAVFVSNHVPEIGVWVVPAVLGTSVLVSYVRAKGETAIVEIVAENYRLNKVFLSGISRYEIRTFLLIIGLISGSLAPILYLILALNLITAIMRFFEVVTVLKTESVK